MGYMRHHAIIVTGSHDHAEHIEKAHAHAAALKMTVTPIVASPVNNIRSFLVAPDGSKEGWGPSDVGDAQRDAFVAYLRSMFYSDLSSPLAWVEAQYGDSDLDTKTIRDSDQPRREGRPTPPPTP